MYMMGLVRPPCKQLASIDVGPFRGMENVIGTSRRALSLPSVHMSRGGRGKPLYSAATESADPPAAQLAPLTTPLTSFELVERMRGKLVLAPLTRGGNLPFRRLCADFGAEVSGKGAAAAGPKGNARCPRCRSTGTFSLSVYPPLALPPHCQVTMSEMAFARMLLKGEPKERAMLRRAANERLFGFQIATNQIDEGVHAAQAAAAAGADWVDLNCG
jgi:hypothetical protein